MKISRYAYTSIIIFTIVSLISVSAVNAQITPGMIYQPADATGSGVLDPNGDGYISKTIDGFQENDLEESEVPFKAIPCPGTTDPSGDQSTGPSCGFTDVVGNPDAPAVLFHIDDNDNLMFRFRVGSGAPNAKGYSILIDTDGEWGTDNPNYIEGNPGFNAEIVLRTKHGVTLYDVEGKTEATQLINLPLKRYHQKAVAHSALCGDRNHFYDFYVPFSTIQAYFPGFTPDSPIRMFASTVTFPNSAIGRNLSDVVCFDDNAYGGNILKMWEDGMDATAPASLNDLKEGEPAIKSDKPVINEPINIGATEVSGTTENTADVVITLYKDGVEIGTTTTSNGSWTISGLTPALAENDTLTATALVPGKTLSNHSEPAVVGSVCTEAPVITGQAGAQNRGYLGTAVPNSTIRIYTNGVLQSNHEGETFVIADGTGNWEFLWCDTGNHCRPCGSTVATAQSDGECESPISNAECAVYSQGGCGSYATTSAPAINSPVLNTETEVTVENTQGDVVDLFLYKNNLEIATETNVAASPTTHTFTGLTLEVNDTLTARAKLSTDGCLSPPSAEVIVESGEQASSPVINEPVLAGSDQTVSGTSTEPEGTEIELFRDEGTGSGPVSVGTTTVNAFGNWSFTGLTLAEGDILTARATNLPNKTESDPSEPVTVEGTSAVPTISGTYTESATTISGTGGTNVGDSILVYVDRAFIGGTYVEADNDSWSLTGFPDYELYPGGEITATQIEADKAESEHSTGVTISCDPPNVSLNVTPSTQEVCENDRVEITVASSESEVIYFLTDDNTGDTLSSTYIGNGDDIILTSIPLTNGLTYPLTLKVKAYKFWDPSCAFDLTQTAEVSTLHLLPDANRTVETDHTFVCSTHEVFINIDAEADINYRLLEEQSQEPLSGWESRASAGNLSISAGTLDTTQSIVVQAQDPSTGCESKMLDGATQIHRIHVADADAGKDIFLCNDDSDVQLEANDPSPGTGTWSVVSGTANFTDPNDPNTTITHSSLTTGVNEVRWTINYDASVCGGSTESTITITTNSCHNTYYTGVNDQNINFWSDVTASYGTIVNNRGQFVRSDTSTFAIAVNDDPDITINSATLVVGSLPPGFNLNLTTGELYIADSTSLVAGSYSFDIEFLNSPPALSGITDYTNTVNVSFQLLPDQVATYTQLKSGDHPYEVGEKIWETSDPDGNIVHSYLELGTGQSFPDWAFLNSDGSITIAKLPVDDTEYTFSYVTIDETGGITKHNVEDMSPMPVEFLYFDAQLTVHGTELSWATASEFNNEGFLVQRSVEGDKWEEIHSEAGQGEKWDETYYNYTDREVFRLPENTVFYRLKQVDFDGKYEYSPIRYIRKETTEMSDIRVYPNPSDGELILQFAISEPANVRYELHTIHGRVIETGEKFWQPGKHEWDLSNAFRTLEPGVYNLKTITNDGVKAFIVVKGL